MNGFSRIWFAWITDFANWRQRRLGHRLNIWAARGIRWGFKSRKKV